MYAVHKGLNPGIYNTWKDTNQQVNGFSGAVFKKVNSRAEAEYFVLHGNLNMDVRIVKSNISKKLMFQKLISGKSVNNIKTSVSINKTETNTETETKTGTEAETEETISMNLLEIQKNMLISKNLPLTDNKILTTGQTDIIEKIEEIEELGEMPLIEEEVSDETESSKNNYINDNDNIKGKELIDYSISLFLKLGTEISNNKIIIYTDGSCINNGKKNAFGGFGFLINTGDHNNGKLTVTENVSNNVAELTSIIESLLFVKEHYKNNKKNILIKTDSKYSINCMCKWYKYWKKNNWKLSTGEDVKNQDLIKKAKKLSDDLNCNFEYVKAHSCIGSYKEQFDYHYSNNDIDSLGNSIADYLSKWGN